MVHRTSAALRHLLSISESPRNTEEIDAAIRKSVDNLSIKERASMNVAEFESMSAVTDQTSASAEEVRGM